MRKKTLLTLTVLALASVTAFAASKDEVVLSKDGRTTIATRGASKASAPYVGVDAGLTVIFDNLGTKYPDGVYWCCEGATIFGPANTLGGPEYWEAAGFTPSTSLSVTKIQVAVGWVNYKAGEFTDVLVSLNADDGTGRPGAVLKKWKTQISGDAFGSCCRVSTRSDAGIPVTAGKQYWVVVSTEKKSDVWAAWNANDTKQLSTDAIPESFWCSGTSSQCGSDNNVWTSSKGYPGYAFAVFGK
jgi:hypothetical protein